MKCNEQILQNLKDAGCTPEVISKYMAIDKLPICQRAICSQKTQLLQAYRKDLMNRLHEEQRKVDCLDHLLYRMKCESEE